jgi:hypothetical protein
VLAVPRSIARSEENRLKTERKLYPFLLVMMVCFRAVAGSGSQVSPGPSLNSRVGFVPFGFSKYYGITMGTRLMAVPPRRFCPVMTIS